MIVIAIMTLVRVALGSIVESCICQGAWIWVSKSHQIRTRNRARLEDFKLFDEASRGFLGSLSLLWRLKGLHLSCIGALIIIVTHGFETFSQQMFVYVQRPTVYINETSRPAPTPFRSDYWDNVVHRGFQDVYSLALSTKSAVYSGILAAQVRDLEPQCHTANCSWPVLPTLAVCGRCVPAPVKVDCMEDTRSCTFSVSPNTNATLPEAAELDIFKVNPVNGSLDASGHKKAYLSMFEIMTISKRATATHTSAAQCALWFCLKAYNISVADGRSQQTLVRTWDESRFEAATSAHSDEHVFLGIPDIMNTQPKSRYSVSDRSLKALRAFFDSLTSGIFEHVSEVVNFSSDWIEAMWRATADLDSWIEKLSHSLTNEVREHGTIRDPYKTDYEGSASKLASYVHVKWYWMIYPALFLTISLYYLVATIIAGARDNVSAWKGDSLPMLFSRIDPRILAMGSKKMDVPKGLDDLGKSKVALAKNNDGYWTFEPHDSGREQDEEDNNLVLGALEYL
ncbi:hypothetical protein CDD83_7233 [Cordyceps sp. RAO-2017]|nr:hypothetical protein CDD83_7233 [Cordyceps sp. RAO-2017]